MYALNTNRRQFDDRRNLLNKPIFPLIDSNFRYVTAERRISVDRRIANIEVKMISIKDHIFKNLFYDE